jgi:Asp-tRNA(Asn)/Glu-tRNA(Gln) amidotransferase A subunit family amidase
VIPVDLKKKADESELQYIWRLALAKDSGALDMTWEELANIFNSNLENNYGSSAYRKKFQQAQHFYDDVFSKMDSATYVQELMEQKRELERLKIQFRDERNAWNKQNYVDARVEQKLDYLEEQLKEIGKIDFPECENVEINSDNDMLVILSDFHIGQAFNSAWGKYDSDIAAIRLEQLAENVRKIAYRHKSENLYVAIS